MDSNKRPGTPIPPNFRPGSPSALKYLSIKDPVIHKKPARITYTYSTVHVTKANAVKQEKQALPSVPDFKGMDHK